MTPGCKKRSEEKMVRDSVSTHSVGSSQAEADHDIDTLAIKLLGFVRRRAKRLQLAFGRYGTGLPKGQDLEDIVAESLASLYGGDRKWDRVKYPDPWAHLVLTSKSLLYNVFSSKERQTTDHEAPEEIVDINRGTPELVYAYEERKNLIYMRLIDRVGSDSQLLKIHDLIEEGYKPVEIAPKLGIPVREVNNLKKRYWRCVSEIASLLDGEA
jgi:DNA-directed RNA polymerase specialized sigma24 family protein